MNQIKGAVQNTRLTKKTLKTAFTKAGFILVLFIP